MAKSAIGPSTGASVASFAACAAPALPEETALLDAPVGGGDAATTAAAAAGGDGDTTTTGVAAFGLAGVTGTIPSFASAFAASAWRTFY